MMPASDKAVVAPPVSVRQGRHDEITILQALENEARSRYAALAGFEFVSAASPISADRLAAGELWVADLDGTAVGLALVQPMDGALYLANISVAPSASRVGIGSTMLGRVVHRADELGASAVTLTTFRSPSWNGPWFRKHGFVLMPEDKIGPGLRAVMTRQANSLDIRTTPRETLWRPTRFISDGGG